VMKVGHVLVLEPIFTPEGAYDRVTWTSGNESVATVYHGVVRALSAGFTTITATTVTQGITATCVIEVVGEGVISVTGVTLNASSATVDVGKTFALVATVLPADATNKAVIWSTSDASIATVNNGVVTGVAPGTATITVTTVDGGFTATCDVTVVYVSVTGVTLDKDAMTVNVGSTGTLVATVLPANATDKTVIWSSSDSRIATVSNGVVTGVAPGTATITVLTADGGFTAECKVTVVSPVIHVTGVTLSETSKTIVLAEEFTLVATVLPANATDKTVYWLSKDSSVATVSNGVVRGVGLGTTEISVTTADGAYTATCEVTVVAAPIPVTGVTVGPTSTSVYVGETVTLIASVIPADATNQNVSWSSSDATIASVDKNGVVTGIAIGTATITVTTEDGGYTADCVVSVVKKDVTPVTGVKLDKTSASLKVGESLALTATVIPDDATNKNVSWSSSNSKVATVINGVVKAVADGKATITVTTEDGGYTSTCEVTVTTPAPAPASDNTLLYIGIAAAIIIVILVAAILMRRS
ncbi:MAG: Ig domain-containing protein, partial [Candidatus Methanomethylophilaceae archaeon]|nr:Ig domain-containing protein [Candidatus Methanomethylophilaceae archaeon]